MLTYCLQNQVNWTKKIGADFPFFPFSFVATLSHWYQDWVIVAIACFETCWNAVRNARRAKFWLKVRSQCDEAGPQPSSLKLIWKPWCSSFECCINRLSDLNSLEDIAVQSLDNRFLDESGNFLVHLGLSINRKSMKKLRLFKSRANSASDDYVSRRWRLYILGSILLRLETRRQPTNGFYSKKYGKRLFI